MSVPPGIAAMYPSDRDLAQSYYDATVTDSQGVIFDSPAPVETPSNEAPVTETAAGAPPAPRPASSARVPLKHRSRRERRK